jgi:hypothetical protein
MSDLSAPLLIAAVAAVGVLHTVVPDHWVPITLIARQHGWSKAETARAALQAGAGHVSSTLVIALVVWFAGVAAAERFGQIVDTAASVALIAFGGWVTISAWLDLHKEGSRAGHTHWHGHSHSQDHSELDEAAEHHEHRHRYDHTHYVETFAASPDEDDLYAPLAVAVAATHCHVHRHDARALPHAHWHDHLAADAHTISEAMDAHIPLHQHRHKTKSRTTLLLILGSSPMIEGIPAFFAAERYGVGLIVSMAFVFAAATIATYVLLCVYSSDSLQRVRLGPLERYGEVLSGAVIAGVGLVFWLWPVA